jgi:hypothetical protein
MMILEITEDKFGKVMKAVSKITEHAECLQEIFEDITDESEYGSRKHGGDDMYNSRYGSRRGGRYSY